MTRRWAAGRTIARASVTERPDPLPACDENCHGRHASVAPPAPIASKATAAATRRDGDRVLDRSMLPTLAGAATVEGYRASNCRASSDNCSPSIRNSSGSSASNCACGDSVGFNFIGTNDVPIRLRWHDLHPLGLDERHLERRIHSSFVRAVRPIRGKFSISTVPSGHCSTSAISA